MRLNIPFYSQKENKYRNDCGAAVIACLADRPVDDVLRCVGIENNRQFAFNDMYFGLRYFGLRYLFRNNLTPDSLRLQLDLDYPVILLIAYDALPKDLQAIRFAGTHWCLVTGYEGDLFYVHDPLRTAAEGGHQIWPADALYAAMQDRRHGNLPCQGLIVQRPYPISVKSEMQAMASDLTAELARVVERNRILENYLYQLYQALNINRAVSEEAQGQAVARAMRLGRRGV